MANQNAKQDENQIFALIGHSGTAGTAETRRVVVSPEGEFLSGEATYQSIFDTANAGTTYIGNALPGGSAGSAVWRIKKIVETGGTQTQIMWADGDANFDNVWNNRGTIVFT